TSATQGALQDYATFDLVVPAGDTVNGIAVELEAAASTNAGTVGVELSWNGGTATTTTGFTTGTLTTTDTIYTLGGSTELWGRSWDPSAGEFDNGSFEVRVIANPSGGNTVRLDALQVRVYHEASGASGGGGGGDDMVEAGRATQYASVQHSGAESWLSRVWQWLSAWWE
ncbi:hypothetical protein GVX82_03480, partial [Patescibacteria group bacterium]|nr:hypothetical protein [Patescibacteria group bacterium]